MLAFACSRGTDLRLCPSGDQSFYRIDLRRSRVGEGGVGDWPANSRWLMLWVTPKEKIAIRAKDGQPFIVCIQWWDSPGALDIGLSRTNLTQSGLRSISNIESGMLHSMPEVIFNGL